LSQFKHDGFTHLACVYFTIAFMGKFSHDSVYCTLDHLGLYRPFFQRPPDSTA
jgi:hypothetical protein